MTTADNAKRLHLITAIFYFIAAGIAGYLVYHHYALINGDAGFGSMCSVSKGIDCDVVNTSKYSEILGVPIATIGLSYYLFGAILALLSFRSAYARRECAILLVPAAIASVFVSALTFSLTIFVLKTFCLFCFSLQITNLVTTALVLLSYRGYLKYNETQKKGAIGLVVLGVILFIGVHGLTAQFKRVFPFDEQSFAMEYRSQNPVSVDPGDAPKQGFQGSNPPLQLVEFADFQCGGCGIAARLMHRLLKVYADKVQLVFKNYPLDGKCNPAIKIAMHPQACAAAKAGRCAHKLGKFEEYYRQLYANQTSLDPQNFVKWAVELGMDRVTFESCLNSEQTALEVQRDIDQASALGVGSTPTFFVNGRKIEGAITEDKLKLLIRDLAK